MSSIGRGKRPLERDITPVKAASSFEASCKVLVSEATIETTNNKRCLDSVRINLQYKNSNCERAKQEGVRKRERKAKLKVSEFCGLSNQSASTSGDLSTVQDALESLSVENKLLHGNFQQLNQQVQAEQEIRKDLRRLRFGSVGCVSVSSVQGMASMFSKNSDSQPRLRRGGTDCWNCGRSGHFFSNCELKPSVQKILELAGRETSADSSITATNAALKSVITEYRRLKADYLNRQRQRGKKKLTAVQRVRSHAQSKACWTCGVRGHLARDCIALPVQSTRPEVASPIVIAPKTEPVDNEAYRYFENTM